jgi:hypothetical protein
MGPGSCGFSSVFWASLVTGPFSGLFHLDNAEGGFSVRLRLCS